METFLPWTQVRRGLKKQVITPLDAPQEFLDEAQRERQVREMAQDTPLLRALGLAHHWQRLLDEGRFSSMTEIAAAEGIATLKSRICTDTCGAPLRFEETKSDTLNLRVSPSFKLALKAAADNEQRSMVNMLEVLVANYCEQHRIVLPTMQQRRREASNSPIEGGK